MLISSQADTFTLGGLLPSFFQFFVCQLNPALAFVSLPVERCCFVCQLAIKACLCLRLPFLPSVMSSLFFILSLPLAPLWSINKWPLLCVFSCLNVKWPAPIHFYPQQPPFELVFPFLLLPGNMFKFILWYEHSRTVISLISSLPFCFCQLVFDLRGGE